MNILITGAVGFIGFHTTFKLLKKKHKIIGVDSLNSYYDVRLKKKRLNILKKKYKNKFIFSKIDISNKKKIFYLFKKYKIDKVINLAAQAGVRYVKKNPDAYFKSNLEGFYNVLEACRIFKIKHLVIASTSSVYGANKDLPFSVHQPADHPIQFYAATKRSNEIIAHSYSHMFNIPITALRFFTVYGPWGRPDMALYLFVDRIIKNKTIDMFNNGNHARDFTYIDDIVTGIIKALNKIPKKDKSWGFKNAKASSSEAPFKILNLGNGTKISLRKYVNIIAKILNKKVKTRYLPMQDGDIKETSSDIKETRKYLGYNPKTNVTEGIRKFIDWYKEYYSI